jgi:hypothetical protein
MKCQWKGCRKQATVPAKGRDRSEDIHPAGVAEYCDDHAEVVAEEGSPEYRVSCPNCSCVFGVN